MINRAALSTIISFFILFSISHAITIGSSAALTGPSQQLGQSLSLTAKRYFESINAKGGIHGQPLRLIQYDDHYDPTPVVYNTHHLIFKDHVDLLFGYVGTPTVVRILPLLKLYNTQNVRLFFPFTGAAPHRTPPYNAFVYNLRASYQEEMTALITHLVKNGHQRFAIFYQCDAYGRNGWECTHKALKSHALSLLKEATYARGARFEDSYATQVDILLSAKPDIIIIIGVYEASAGFIRDLRNANSSIPVTNLSFVSATDVYTLLTKLEKKSQTSYTHNLIFSQVVPNYQDAHLPAIREYQTFLKKTGLNPSFVGFEGFLNAKLLVKILEKVPPPFSKEKLLATLKTPHHFDLGIDTPVVLGGEHHQGLHKVYFTTIQNNRFVTIKEWSKWQK